MAGKGHPDGNYIYAVRRADGDIKIGYTHRMNQRMAHMTRQHGEVEILGYMNGGYRTEAELHERFRVHRRRQARSIEKNLNYFTDWFAPVPEILEFIAANMRPFINSAAKRYGKVNGTRPTQPADASREDG